MSPGCALEKQREIGAVLDRSRPRSLDGPQGSALSTDLKKTASLPSNTSQCRNRMTRTFLEIVPEGETRIKGKQGMFTGL